MALFSRGSALAASRGLILVDTKYEFGISEDGVRMLADEVHTPDSSRYWVSESYEERFQRNQEPESLDKEFLRLWLREKGITDAHVPPLDDDIRVDVACRYMDLFERMTGESFSPDLEGGDPVRRIQDKIKPLLMERTYVD